MRRYAIFTILIGLLGILLSWSTVWCIEIIRDAFASNLAIGWFLLAGFLLIGVGIVFLCWYEFRGYLSIRTVDRLATSLQSDDLNNAKKQSIRWLRIHTQSRRIEAICAAHSTEEIKSILIPYINSIDRNVDAFIAKEALLSGAIVGISPWALVDAIVVGWRQLRLMRAIATAYGVRPSSIGTIRLVRRVLISVAFADASEHLTQWIARKVPSMGGILPSAGQAVAIAVLTARLGRACKIACRPLERSTSHKLTLFSKIKEFAYRVTKKTASKEKRTRCSFTATPPPQTPKVFIHPRSMEPNIP